MGVAGNFGAGSSNLLTGLNFANPELCPTAPVLRSCGARRSPAKPTPQNFAKAPGLQPAGVAIVCYSVLSRRRLNGLLQKLETGRVCPFFNLESNTYRQKRGKGALSEVFPAPA
jgi:hypothetical protein